MDGPRSTPEPDPPAESAAIPPPAPPPPEGGQDADPLGQDTRFRRAIEQASGGDRVALLGMVALAVVIGLALVFGY